MHPRISITGSVCQSVGPSVGPSVGHSVGRSCFCQKQKIARGGRLSPLIFLETTKYIYRPVFRLKLLFFGLLEITYGCISGLVLTHMQFMYNWRLLFSIQPYRSHIPSGRFSMHHNCHPALIQCITIFIATFFISVRALNGIRTHDLPI